MLQENLIAIYCIIDDMLKAVHHKFDKRAKVSDSEVLTIGIISSLYFGGVWDDSLKFFKSFGVFSNALSRSRFCRRLHKVEPLLEDIIASIGVVFTDIISDKQFLEDSTPLPVCDNMRIGRSKMLAGEEFRGYHASFRRYFYGIKLQLLTNKEGIPIAYALTEGSLHDGLGKHEINYTLSPESEVFADAAYSDSDFESTMMNDKCIIWSADRKANQKKQHPKETKARIMKARKRIETVFSEIKSLFKRYLHAVTIEGFMLKIKLFISAYQLKKTILK
jgi:hypothetical protein